MFQKIALSAGGLVAAASLPIVLCTVSEYWKNPGRKPPVAAVAGAEQAPASLVAAQSAADPVPGANAAAPSIANRLEGVPIRSLDEVLRFDLTPDWILHRWPRVSTGLAQLDLQGYRVPLVSGTRESDLAGALTYYFDAQQQVARITFRGSSGDVRPLVTLLMGRFQFTRRLTNDPSLFVYEAVQSSGKPAGGLRIRSAPVVKASDPHQRFELDLMMDRPEG